MPTFIKHNQLVVGCLENPIMGSKTVPDLFQVCEALKTGGISEIRLARAFTSFD